MTGLTLDASCALSLVLPDETDLPWLRQRLAAQDRRGLWVPNLWPLETANGVLMAERRGRIAQGQTPTVLQTLARLGVNVDEDTPLHARGDTFEMARKYRLTIYDAAYVELALRRGLDLASSDKAMRRAAQAEGVTVIG